MKAVAMLNTVRAFFAGLLVALLAGCVSRTVVLEGHRAFPRKPEFAIVPREHAPEELARAGLRTDGVYMEDRWHPPELDSEEREAWRKLGGSLGSGYYRFWANGRAMIRTARVEREDFTAEHADSFERARLGYHQILPDGTIEVEWYVYDGGQWRYVYRKYRIRIRNDEIWVRMPGSPQFPKSYLVYRFRPVPGMKAEPDW